MIPTKEEIINEFKPDDIQKARKVLSDLCSNRGQYFRMSIPVDRDDSDMVLSRVIKFAEKAALDTQNPAGGAVKPVAWQVYNELVKEWTTAYADKAKADQLVKDGYKVRPLYAALTGDCGGGDWQFFRNIYGYKHPSHSGKYMVRLKDKTEIECQYDGRFFRDAVSREIIQTNNITHFKALTADNAKRGDE